MNADKNAPRLLGAAFLIVVLTSLTSGLVLLSAVGSGAMSDVLLGASRNLALVRISNVLDLATSAGVVALAALLYLVLNGQSRVVALIALGWWLAEAIVLALASTGASGLVALSLAFVRDGAPLHSSYQALGEFLYLGLYKGAGSTIHMFFYCIGGIAWYYLFYRSRYIPRVISLWGLAAVSVGLVGIVLQLLGFEVPIFVYLPILPFELAIGAWLMLKGIKNERVVVADEPGP